MSKTITVRIEWTEQASYTQDFDIEVEDDFDETDKVKLAELIDEDDTNGTGWLDDVNWDDVESVSDREVESVTVV